MVRGYNAFDNVQLTASFTQVTSNVPDVCASQGSRSSGRLNDGEVICLGNSDPMWFSIADVQGQNGIAITTANGSGDLSLATLQVVIQMVTMKWLSQIIAKWRVYLYFRPE